MGHLVRKALLVTGAALVAAAVVTASASAAKPAITFVAPSPAEGATLTTNSASFKFTYAKKPNATRTLVCALSGPTPSTGPCDQPVASGAKGSQSGKTYSGLTNGSYTLTVSLTLTDGGTATGTRHFTVNVPPPDPFAAVRAVCEDVPSPGSGVFVPGTSTTFYLWACRLRSDDTALLTAKVQALSNACTSDGGFPQVIGNSPFDVDFLCRKT